LRLTGLPQPSLGARLEKAITGGAFWKIAIPSAMGAVLALLLLLGTLKPRLRAENPLGPAADGLDRAPADREATIREIATLDERFQQGEVAEADYLVERETLVYRALGHFESTVQAPQREKEVTTDE